MDKAALLSFGVQVVVTTTYTGFAISPIMVSELGMPFVSPNAKKAPQQFPDFPLLGTKQA